MAVWEWRQDGKAQLELRFARNTEGNKSFYHYFSKRRLNKGHARLLLNEAAKSGHNGQKANVLDAFFASVFSYWVSQGFAFQGNLRRTTSSR